VRLVGLIDAVRPGEEIPQTTEETRKRWDRYARFAERTFNVEGKDAAFNQMVLLGHSMGGLLSHAMVVNSEQKFWHLNTHREFEDMVGPPDVLAELRKYYIFDALPFIKRVVFLASPHRGSDLWGHPADGTIAAGRANEDLAGGLASYAV